MRHPLAGKLLESARQSGEQDLLLGFRYYLGVGAPQDYARALRHFRASAQTGSAWAEYAIGLMYESGRGVERSLHKAMAWYGQAARRGHGPALCALGMVPDATGGTLQALELFRLASQPDNAGRDAP